MGKSSGAAAAALEGYTIISDKNGNYIDFNNNAGGGWGSKGEKVVYIGYKTTTDRQNAITDIALMNMKGGYSVEDYDALMDSYLKEQIIPFVDSFMAAIREYRENYKFGNAANKTRANYIHDVLNKFTDDDCDGKGLGDLLLNETKYEMGDDAYDRLSESEKANHADIVTIIAQANGKATLVIENLLVRGADSNENTWIDRLAETTYDDLLEETGLSLTKAQKELDKLYYDDAMRILGMWDTFKEQLDHYDEATAKLEEFEAKDYSEQIDIIETTDLLTASEEQAAAYGQAVAEMKVDAQQMSNALADVLCKDYLESVETEDGTLLDLFTTPSSEIDADITMIYPVVASLSEGQRAGLDLLTLEDLVVIGSTDEKGYQSADYDTLTPASIYDNVDRAIYAKGGVGLTSDALRANAAGLVLESSETFSPLTYAMICLSGVSMMAFVISLGYSISTAMTVSATSAKISSLTAELATANSHYWMLDMTYLQASLAHLPSETALKTVVDTTKAWAEETEAVIAENSKYLARLQEKSSFCNKLSAGLGVAMIVLVAVTTYLSYRDLVNYYKVEFTPIPRYMVDEKDITSYNANGEKIVIKNQSAYYKVVTCNRTSSDEFYGTLEDAADLNGDVGSQWLALYCAKNEAELPILADSLNVVTGNPEVPAGYTAGVHMFGTGAAENINNPLYIWNSAAKSVYLYYKTADGKSPSLAGSGFSAGTIALSGGTGLIAGALISWILFRGMDKKKKETETAEA